nr:cob(I)yrinic acid a,c-diamide adenosyltransferase [Ruminococcus sp. BSD2780120874_150323_B10]
MIFVKHIYYGDGKGKTTAAIGLAVRAAGSKMKVLFVQFLKTEFSGERHILSHTENVTLTFCPLELKFTFDMDDKEKAQAAKIFKGIFDNAVTTALTEKYDMVVLDEVFEAINAHMLSESEVYEFITNAPSSMEIVMTGHNPPQKFMDCADYITEFKKIKHPYDRGITGRIGIEF